MTPINEMPVERRIKAWRSYGRGYARHALALIDPDDDCVEAAAAVAANAALASMCFALAADAARFGDLPEPPEEST